MNGSRQGRTTWQELPSTIHGAVAELIGGPVTEATSQANGFSPGSADRVRSVAGRRAFVKAVSRERNEGTYDLHRREIAAMQSLPGSVPAPRLLGSFDDGEWVALVLEDIDGTHPRADASGSDAATVLDALESFPVVRDGEGPIVLPGAATELDSEFRGWTRIRTDGAERALPDWASQHIDELEALAEGAAAAIEGDHLLHLDLRADNVLIDARGKAWVVDWPWAAVGVRWLDGLTFLLDARVHGTGVDTERMLREHPLFAEATEGAINAVLSGLTSYFFTAAMQPAPPTMPTLRSFQWSEAMAGMEWLRERLD